MEKKKKQIIPQGLPGATPGRTRNSGSTKPPTNFVPAGIPNEPTPDAMANFLLRTFANAKVPRLPKKKKK